MRVEMAAMRAVGSSCAEVGGDVYFARLEVKVVVD
jgi:hypothetical protein